MARHSRKQARKNKTFTIKKLVEGLYSGVLNIADLPQKTAFKRLDDLFRNGNAFVGKTVYLLGSTGYFDLLIAKRKKLKKQLNPGSKEIEIIIQLAEFIHSRGVYVQHEMERYIPLRSDPLTNLQDLLSKLFFIKLHPLLARHLLEPKTIKMFKREVRGRRAYNFSQEEEQAILEAPAHFCIEKTMCYAMLRAQGANKKLAEMLAQQLTTDRRLHKFMLESKHWRLLLDMAMKWYNKGVDQLLRKVCVFAKVLTGFGAGFSSAQVAKGAAQATSLWIRQPEDFDYNLDPSMTDYDFYIALVKHLFVRYEVPKFLWPNQDDFLYVRRHNCQRKTAFFVHVAQGGNIRTAPDFPFKMTSREAHFFMQAPDTADIKQAYRFGQLRAMGATEHLATDMSLILSKLEQVDETYQLTVMRFFSKHFTSAPKNLAHMILFIALKYQKEGNYQLKGRTLQSFRRDFDKFMETTFNGFPEATRNRYAGNLNFVHYWYREIINLYLRKFPWQRQAIPDFSRNDGLATYKIRQLNTTQAVETEGKEMKHCVGSYVMRCITGQCSIWSMTQETIANNPERMVTIEVRDRRIVQVKGKSNRAASPHEMGLINEWKRTAELV